MKPLPFTLRCLCLAIVLLAAATHAAHEMTALDLVSEGNRYIGEESKDKVVQIRSEKSVNSLSPVVWFIVYHDPNATMKAVEVKFVGGRKVEVKRPLRLLEPISKADEPMDRSKLKTDSDRAIEIATREPALDRLTVKASRATLGRRSGDDPTPVWKIRLWAAKLKNPNDNVDIGEVILSAEDGHVIKADLKPERVD